MSKESESASADKLTGAFVKVREKREALKAAFDTEDAKYAAMMDGLKAELLKICADQGADSIKTSHGTVMRTIKVRYWPSDWEAMGKFILDNEAPELLEKRISQRNMAQFLEEHPDKMPIGLNVDRKYEVTVRKSTK